MKKLFLLSVLGTFSLSMDAQYSTPGTGVHWDLDSLLNYSNGVVYSGEGGYGISEDFHLSENDTLTLYGPLAFLISENVLITISGVANVGQAELPVVFTAGGEDIHWGGMRIEETATAYFESTTFSDGGGIKCISGDVDFVDCKIERHENLATNSAALEFFSGTPFVTDCVFELNAGAAISSPANIGCAPQINSSQFLGNNTENSNRPQINLGPSGEGEIIYIIDNTIIGDPNLDQAGGIAISSLFGVECGVLIEGNRIETNRYGIALAGGGVSGQIANNELIDNNTQGLPFSGGSGINLNGSTSSSAIVYDNLIVGNLWGITVQGDFQVDLGNPEVIGSSVGNNTFGENGNGGVTYALYNNTSSPIPAMNNCWIQGQNSTSDEVEDVIFHSVDDSNLGMVDFSGYQCGIIDALTEFEIIPLRIHPNPAANNISIELLDGNKVIAAFLVDAIGREISLPLSDIAARSLNVRDLSNGVYNLTLQTDQGIFVGHFVKD